VPALTASHLFEEYEIIPETSANSHNQVDPIGLGDDGVSDEESTEEQKERNQRLIDELAVCD
jgi:hypothetical protein